MSTASFAYDYRRTDTRSSMLRCAASWAAIWADESVDPVHLLMSAWCDLIGSSFIEFLDTLAVPRDVFNGLHSRRQRMPAFECNMQYRGLSDSASQVVKLAEADACHLGHDFLAAPHMLVGLVAFEGDSEIDSILKRRFQLTLHRMQEASEHYFSSRKLVAF